MKSVGVSGVVRVWMHGLCSVLCFSQSVVKVHKAKSSAWDKAKKGSGHRTEEQAYIGRWHPGHRCTPIGNQPAPQVLWEKGETKY